VGVFSEHSVDITCVKNLGLSGPCPFIGALPLLEAVNHAKSRSGPQCQIHWFSYGNKIYFESLHSWVLCPFG